MQPDLKPCPKPLAFNTLYLLSSPLAAIAVTVTITGIVVTTMA